MKSKINQVSDEARRFADTLVREGINLDSSLKDTRTFRKLIRLGILHPYADSFLYGGKAFFICGTTGIGKTPIIKTLRERFGAKVRPLVEDNPFLYWDGCNSRPVTYSTGRNYPDLFLDALVAPENHTPYELESIILLRKDSPRGFSPLSQEGLNELLGFLTETYNLKVDNQIRRKMEGVLQKVSCIEYGKSYGYENYNSLERVTKDVALSLGIPKRKVEPVF